MSDDDEIIVNTNTFDPRNATDSMKGYIHQLHESIICLFKEGVNNVKIEGLEDIDYIWGDNNKVLIQVKYHKDTISDNENLGCTSGFYKVYRSFILNYEKYNNVSSIIYSCFCEGNFKGKKEFKLNRNDFIKYLRDNKIKSFMDYIKKDKNKLNIKYKNIDKNEELNEKFLSLIEIKITENFKIDFNKIYNDIINSNLFEIINRDAFYIREFLFQKIYRYVIENLFNGNNEIIKGHFINEINTQLKNEITLNNLLDDIIIISNNTQYLNNSLYVIDNVINNIHNNEELFNIIIKYQVCSNIELKNRSKKILITFINNILNKIDINNQDYYKIFNNILKHIKCINNGNCKYYHFENLLENKKFNKIDD
jgi:hypothetical protein